MLEIFRSYLKNEDYFVTMYSNYIYIYKYQEIIKFTNNIISVKLKDLLLNIIGNNLLITKMEKNELLIKGNINKLEKIYE